MLSLIRHISLFFCITIWVAFSPSFELDRQSGNDNSIIVVTNNSNSTSDLTKKELKAILKGEVLRWQDKKKILLATMKSNTAVGKLTAKLLNMSANDMDQFYLMQVFQGKISAPRTFESADELKNYVANTPGAIGIIESGINPNNVKTIKIDGLETITF